MDANDYQSKCLKFAMNVDPIPPEMAFMLYASLKLAGEAGEFVEKMGKLIRDKRCKLTPEMKESMVLELGDCAWYISVLAQELGVSLDQVFQANIDKLEDRESRGVISGSGDYR